MTDCTLRMCRDAEPGYPGMMEDLEPMSRERIYMRNARNVRFRNVSIQGYQGEKEGKMPWDMDESCENVDTGEQATKAN